MRFFSRLEPYLRPEKCLTLYLYNYLMNTELIYKSKFAIHNFLHGYSKGLQLK